RSRKRRVFSECGLARRRYDLRASCRNGIRVWTGQGAQRLPAAAAEHDGLAGAVVGRRRDRSRFHLTHRDHAHRQRREEGNQGQVDRSRAARRHHRRTRKVFLMSTHMFDPDAPSSGHLQIVADHRHTSSIGERLPRTDILEDTDVHLLDYIKVLYKRRWTALTVFLLVVLSVVVYVFTATPIYEARSRILIE